MGLGRIGVSDFETTETTQCAISSKQLIRDSQPFYRENIRELDFGAAQFRT